jgi:hypothetical protein
VKYFDWDDAKNAKLSAMALAMRIMVSAPSAPNFNLLALDRALRRCHHRTEEPCRDDRRRDCGSSTRVSRHGDARLAPGELWLLRELEGDR